MIENLKKHAGQLANTGVRVAVVFRKLPNDENYCLIVETERLPDSYHDYVIQCLNSKEAAETNEFYEVLNRRTFPDGLNCLTALHQRGFLRKEPVSNVTMLPLPGQAVPLALINATIDGKLEEYKKSKSDSTTSTPSKKDEPVQPTAVEGNEAVARNLIAQAEMLEEDARLKREQAYTMVPSLKPGKGRPKLSEEEKVKSEEDRKIKRRERDRKKAAEAKVQKKEDVLDQRVQDRLSRKELQEESN